MDFITVFAGTPVMVKWGDEDNRKFWRQAEIMECSGDEIVLGFEDGDHEVLGNREMTVQTLTPALRYKVDILSINVSGNTVYII